MRVKHGRDAGVAADDQDIENDAVALEAARPPARLQRVVAEAAISVRHDREGGVTRLARLKQSGSVKIRMPRVHGPAPEAVLINTAGGLTGGDRLDVAIDIGAGAALSLSTQAAERVYRARDGEPPAQVALRMTLGPGAALDWLPQETILFDGGRLSRRIEVDMADDARLLIGEAVVCGRRAMGETVVAGALVDQWRIRRGGRLVHAEALRLEAPIAPTLARPAVGAGAAAFAGLAYLAPDAETRLEETRSLLDGLCADLPGSSAGAAAFDGKLVIRMTATTGAGLRKAILGFLSGFKHGNLPRVWSL